MTELGCIESQGESRCATQNQSQHRRTGVSALHLFQQVPGFAVDFEAGAFLTPMRVEPEIFSSGEGLYWDYVPEIEGDDVGDDYVDFAFGERDHLVFDVDVGVDGVSAMTLIGGGADLHAP